jgi:GT2 family glycosyltransferase
MKLLIIVINWNGEQELLDCLSSLRSTSKPWHFDVLVLDNASTRGSLAQAQSEFSEFHFLLLKENLFWAGGNNRAIEWALARDYEWIVLSNSDIIVDDRWLSALTKVVPDPLIGAVGFKVFGEAQRVPFEDFENYCSSYQLENLEWQNDEFISGCFLAVRSECFRKLGVFDEVYKMYSEEHDFLKRVRMAGWRTVRCNAPIWHVSESASRRVPFRSSYFAIRNEMRFRIKFEKFALFKVLKTTCKLGLDMLNPFVKVSLKDSCQRRRKPTMNPFINQAILSKAFFWNLIHFSQTKNIAREESRLALNCRATNNFGSK